MTETRFLVTATASNQADLVAKLYAGAAEFFGDADCWVDGSIDVQVEEQIVTVQGKRITDSSYGGVAVFTNRKPDE
jgi:hypothetical protein